MADEHRIINLHVNNEAGVLTRITGLIRREGWNIKDLTVAEGINPQSSRMTIGVLCRPSFLPLMVKKLENLTCVQDIGVCTPDQCREYAVVSITAKNESENKCEKNEYEKIEEIALRYKATLLKRQDQETLFEIMGALGVVDKFIDEIKDLGKLRVARSGAVALVDRS